MRSLHLVLFPDVVAAERRARSDTSSHHGDPVMTIHGQTIFATVHASPARQSIPFCGFRRPQLLEKTVVITSHWVYLVVMCDEKPLQACLQSAQCSTMQELQRFGGSATVSHRLPCGSPCLSELVGRPRNDLVGPATGVISCIKQVHTLSHFRPSSLSQTLTGRHEVRRALKWSPIVPLHRLSWTASSKRG